LTTAASLWTVAAIGLEVGGGLYVESVAATLIILVILAGIKPLEEWYQKRGNTHEIRLRVDSGTMSIDTLNNAPGYRSRRVTRYVSVPASDPQFEEVTVTLQRLSSTDVTDIVHQLEALPNVREAAKA
jgi:putative Mg2+ transporter-C (MgtC) family protein